MQAYPGYKVVADPQLSCHARVNVNGMSLSSTLDGQTVGTPHAVIAYPHRCDDGRILSVTQHVARLEFYFTARVHAVHFDGSQHVCEHELAYVT